MGDFQQRAWQTQPAPVTYRVQHHRSHAPNDWRLVGRWHDLETALTFFRAEARALTCGRVVLVNEQTHQTLETVHAGIDRTRW